MAIKNKKTKQRLISNLNVLGYGLFEIKYILEHEKEFPCNFLKRKENEKVNSRVFHWRG